MRRTRIVPINNLTERELHPNIENKPTSQIYFEKMFQNKPIRWDDKYLLPHKISKLSNSPPCSFWKHENETSLHIF